MFRLEISDDELEAKFSCPFCAKTYDWPFGARIIWKGTAGQQAYPDARHVIFSHFIGDSNLKQFGFPKCPEDGKWRDTTWEWIDQDSGTRLGGGTVQMVQQWPRIQ